MLTKQTKATTQLDPGDEQFSFEGIEGDNDMSDTSGPPAFHRPQPFGSSGATNIIHFFTKINSISSTGVKEMQRVCNLCR